MEALNDIGASEFLGVRTLSVSIYTTLGHAVRPAGRRADRACDAPGRGAPRDGRTMGAAASTLCCLVEALRIPSSASPLKAGGAAAAFDLCATFRFSIGFVAPAALPCGRKRQAHPFRRHLDRHPARARQHHYGVARGDIRCDRPWTGCRLCGAAGSRRVSCRLARPPGVVWVTPFPEPFSPSASCR